MEEGAHNGDKVLHPGSCELLDLVIVIGRFRCRTVNVLKEFLLIGNDVKSIMFHLQQIKCQCGGLESVNVEPVSGDGFAKERHEFQNG